VSDNANFGSNFAEDLIENKVKGNINTGPCDCAFVDPNDDDDDLDLDDDVKAIADALKPNSDDEECSVLKAGEMVVGNKKEICDGNLPPTKKEREDEIK